jgi:hypothetical protein
VLANGELVVLGPGKGETTAGLQTLYSEELHVSYPVPIIRVMSYIGHVARMGMHRSATFYSVEREGKIQLGRSRRRWLDYVKMDILKK